MTLRQMTEIVGGSNIIVIIIIQGSGWVSRPSVRCVVVRFAAHEVIVRLLRYLREER